VLLHVEEIEFGKLKEMAIGVGEGGFHMSETEKINLYHWHSSEYKKVFRWSDTDGHVAHYMRDMEFLLSWAKQLKSIGLRDDIEIVRIPSDIRCKICSDPITGAEWIEEIHRKWKADSKSLNDASFGLGKTSAVYSRGAKKQHTEENARSRKVVIDILSER
jgi:hypothetical protein